MADDAGEPRTSRLLSIAAVALGVIAVFVVPILFGTAGLVVGYVAARRGDRLGSPAMAVAGVGMVVGLVLEAVVLA